MVDHCSDAKLARKARDYAELKTVYSGHAFCLAAQAQRHELDTYWAREQDGIAYAIGDRVWCGREAVYGAYAEAEEKMREKKLAVMHEKHPDKIAVTPENLGVGDLVMRFETSPYLEISQDGASAKGLWQVIGISNELDQNGEPTPYLHTDRELVDFVREHDGWKILRLTVKPGRCTRLAKDVILNKRKLFRTAGGTGAMVPGNIKLEPFACERVYAPDRVAVFAPELPKPCATYDPDHCFCKVVGALEQDPDCMPGGAYYAPDKEKEA